MKFPGFVGPAYTLNSVSYDCQNSINLYLEKNELGTGKNAEPYYLVGRPGLIEVENTINGFWRGMYRASNGVLYGVCGSNIYRINSDGSFSKLRKSDGTFYEITATSTTRCVFADNGEYMLITTGDPDNYVDSPPVDVKLSSEVCSENTSAASADIFGAYWVEYKTGRFILVGYSTDTSPTRGKGIFWYSDLDSAGVSPAFQALQFLQAESSPDKLWQCVSSNDYLWMPGEKTVEVWQTTGDSSAPYQRVTGAIIEYGSIGSTFCRVNNTVAWCGSQMGTPHVYAASGLSAERISNHGVEQALSKYDAAGAYAWSYSDRGHNFYVLTFPAEGATWMYDFSTGAWCELKSYDYALNINGHLSQYRGACHEYAYGKHFVGDYMTGAIYVMDDNYRYDGALPIYMERTSPHICMDYKRIFYRRFLLDCEMGNPGPIAVCTRSCPSYVPEPMVTYSWSDDGGRTFTGYLDHTMGGIGEYRNRIYWQRLGCSRDRVHRVRFSSSNRVVILGADLEIEMGAN